LKLISVQFIYDRQPFHDYEIVDLIEAINARASPAIRPQELNNEETRLWDLFETCWRPIPEQRPNTTTALSQLQNIIETHHV
jgi:hypothetical protein